MAPPVFHIVLVEPEIPNNTGNIGRTCIATGCALHLIHPLGFDTSVKALRRAGLDYWPRLAVSHHDSWEAYLAAARPERIWITSGIAGRAPWRADLRAGDHLVFGKETAGLSEAILRAHADRAIRMPMIPGERGLNVATAVCALVYEGIRQCADRGEISVSDTGDLTASR
jgi:tRNA (cytidine/uridine-2'-O-)-methyltransferase